MASNLQGPSSPGAGFVVLRLATGDFRLAAADGEQMRDALVRYLRTEPSVREIPLLTPESSAWMREADEVEIDDGTMRVGAWLLQTRSGAPVLTHRSSAGGGFGFQYVAVLARGQQGWSVASLAWEKVRFSR